MMNDSKKRIVLTVIPLLIALLSIFVVSKYATSTEFNAKTIEALDDKKTTVMELTAASTAAAAAITLIPGDTATPIANKLADLSGYFLIVLCAIYLEKYLLTITGYAAFTFLIPIACVIYSMNICWKNDIGRQLAHKLVIFGIAIVCVIPGSVKVSNLIERTYQSSIDQTIEAAKETTQNLENNIENQEKQEEGVLSGIITKAKETVTGFTTGVITKVQNIVNQFMEALAVMIVTSCVIPIIVMLFFVWLAKTILGADIEVKLPTSIGASSGGNMGTKNGL